MAMASESVSRRAFAGGGLAWLAAGCAMSGPTAEEDAAACRWQPGELAIHFIHTGTGEQTFFECPDGTTILLDCGHVAQRRPGYAEAVPARPSARLRGGEWTARYLARLTDRREIDWVLVSHWHDDHVMGLPDVARTFAFRRWLDHQHPLVGRRACDANGDSMRFAREFVPAAESRGMVAGRFEAGARNQIHLVHDASKRFADFEIRNLAADGVLWDGRDGSRDFAAEHARVTRLDAIPENQLSCAFRLRYGAFTHYTGGDLEQTFQTESGPCDWEAAVGAACGPVDACKTNHHAYWNAMRAGFVRAVRPRVYLSSTWSPNQVNDRNLPTMCSRDLYGGERTVHFGFVPAAAEEAYAGRPFWRDVASPCGHAVVKVPPGGRTFELFTLSTDGETPRVLARRQFRSRGRA